MLSHNLTPLGSFYTVELNYLLLITDLDLSISTQDAQTKFDIEKPMTLNSKVASNSPLLLFLRMWCAAGQMIYVCWHSLIRAGANLFIMPRIAGQKIKYG